MCRSLLSLALTVTALAAIGCAATPQGGLRERVGGELRTRSFASPTAYEAYLRAELAASRGDYATALRQLDLAALADPSDGFLAARSVELMAASGDLEGARAAAERVVRERPDLAAGWLSLAAIRVRVGDEPGAMTAVARALALDAGDPDVRASAAEVAGGDSHAVAAARSGAPLARSGDRVLAARALPLDPAGMFRRSAAARRRAAAVEHAARGEWAAVDAMLSPLVELDPTRATDRVRVIEARAFDGRASDAARLVGALRVGGDGASVRPSERARLWLVAGRADLAAEEARAIVEREPDDLLAIRVLGHALLRSGHAAEGIDVLTAVPVDAPAEARVCVDHEPFVGAIAGGADDVPGEPVGAPGMAWALARADASHALRAAGLDDIADRVLAHSVSALRAPEMRGARDRLRVARSRSLSLRGAAADARAALSGVETAWGRHRRGALLARTEAPGAALADLRARSGDVYEDALADAWAVLVCGIHAGACEEREVTAGLERAHRGAPTSPMTLRALAVRTGDRREAAELMRRAAARDPASPWTASILRQLGGR